jgi:hypothetical protein
MEEMESFNTFPLIDVDLFKKQLKNYYVLFSQQQSIPKQSKKKKAQIEEMEVASKSKPKKAIAVSDDGKLNQFKVSFHSTVSGIIEFNHNADTFALEFNINNPKTKKTYKEIIYLPIVVDIKEILTIVQNLKEDIYTEFSNGKLNDSELTKNFDYLELSALENELISITHELKQVAIHNINAELQAENELLIKYRMLYEHLQAQLKTNPQKETIEYQNAMKEYLMVNQTLNHVVDENGNILVYPGTRVIFNQKHGIITEIDNTACQYTIKFDGGDEGVEIVPMPKKNKDLQNDLMILGSVRNSISKSKNEILSQSINLSELIKKINNTQILIDVLVLLNIDLPIPEIINRPRLEIYTNIDTKIPKKITVIDKINTFFSNIDLTDVFNKQEYIVIGKKVKDLPNDMDIQLSNWRQIFSMDDISMPFIIDDFEFNSIKHYHIASQFYNREDLSVNLKMEYNNFFVKFTNNFTGIDSLSNIETHLLNIHIDNYPFKKPLIWSMNIINGDSLESIYLKKGYYNKFNQNQELRQALINTYPKIIYERIGKNKLLINYELMLVRYYLYNNITPYFSKFNYNSSIYKIFIEDKSETKEYEYKILLNVFLTYDAYDNREKLFVDINVLYGEYTRLDISGKTSFQVFTKYCKELLFSYNSVFIYELVYNFIVHDTIAHKSIDVFLKKYDLWNDEYKWIFQFYYQYITSILLSKQKVVEDDLLFEKQLDEKYRALQATLKANNYLIVESAFRLDNSFLDSIIEFLNRNKFKPFDLSSNSYSYSAPTSFKNKLLSKKEFTVYESANNYLYSLMNELYDINNTSEKQFDETDYFERLEILSRILSLDIQIITEDNIVDIKFEDSKEKYPNKLQDKIMFYEKPRGKLVLGHINDTDYFFSTKPYFASQDREYIKYLIACNSNYVIEEETSDSGEITHKIIGKWDADNLVLDTKDIEPGDKLNDDVEIEDFILYSLGDRIYYKDRELYV